MVKIMMRCPQCGMMHEDDMDEIVVICPMCFIAFKPPTQQEMINEKYKIQDSD